jgi:phytoene dehydrogenase-like protein
MVNAAFYALHKSVAPLQRKLHATAMYGLRFLADDAQTSSEYRSKSAVGHITGYSDVRDALIALAENEGVKLLEPSEVEILRLDESGVDVKLAGKTVRAKALVIAGHLSPDQQKLLGMPESWGEGVLHRHTFALLKMPKSTDTRPTIPMSLDLKGSLSWGWMLQTEDRVQVSVSQPVESSRASRAHSSSNTGPTSFMGTRYSRTQ